MKKAILTAMLVLAVCAALAASAQAQGLSAPTSGVLLSGGVTCWLLDKQTVPGYGGEYPADGHMYDCVNPPNTNANRQAWVEGAIADSNKLNILSNQSAVVY